MICAEGLPSIPLLHPVRRCLCLRLSAGDNMLKEHVFESAERRTYRFGWDGSKISFGRLGLIVY